MKTIGKRTVVAAGALSAMLMVGSPAHTQSGHLRTTSMIVRRDVEYQVAGFDKKVVLGFSFSGSSNPQTGLTPCKTIKVSIENGSFPDPFVVTKGQVYLVSTDRLSVIGTPDSGQTCGISYKVTYEGPHY